MRYISSDIIFTSNGPPLKKGVLVVNEAGFIQDILPNKDLIDSGNLEFYEGAICPGFINTHCHLELSHMKGQLPKKSGLPSFIASIVENRIASDEIISLAIQEADDLMLKNGIVGVGDISNNHQSFIAKDSSPIAYHTFLEVFGTQEDFADSIFQSALHLKSQCKHLSSITPHANYSVSQALLKKIAESNTGECISIHNQETPSEDEMFLNGTGELARQLSTKRKFTPTRKSALQSTLPFLPITNVLLVHNTFTSHEDILWVQNNYSNVYWTMCPKANLYIENTLPNFALFLEKNIKVTVGTDSLASNDTLCILSELKLIQKQYEISLNTLITWACRNGAEALNFNTLGSFEIGKCPGINHLSQLHNGNLCEDTAIKKIC